MTSHLPERPQLAPGLRFAGQMRESAFVDPPWLLEREWAGYIQVTELLYHVAEQCTGQHSVEDIADQVSLTTGRRVSADNVRYLLARCLLPRALVLPANGVAATPGDRGRRSLLALNMRARMLSPRVIDPAARLLSRLYWPPLLLAILCIAAVCEGWLYLVHGVSGSLHDVLYTPALMLVVLAVIVVSAAFHEFGHAAALTYGGGKVKAMGVGLYLVYPAFYTDVSDNYRLPRWARVRTDLGGFYFNLLVGLGLLGVYARTGQEFLLLIVLLINLEILHQLFPFVRLDGYWALADLTGLPDLFTYMGAFLADVLPIEIGTRGKLPPLKRWARVVFAAYLLIAVPLLGTLLFLMIRGVPRILATAWDSLHQQGIALVQARAVGDGLAMTFAVLQMGLLALPTIGLVLTLAGLARRALDALWIWGRPTPVRRAIGALGTAAAAALLAFLWAPQLPFEHGPGPLYAHADFAPIRTDERGTVPELVAAMATTTRSPRTDEAPTGRVVAETPRPVTPADANAEGQASAAASRSRRVDQGDAPPSPSRAKVDGPNTTPSALPPAPAVPIASPSPQSTQAIAVATVVPIASAVPGTSAHAPARPSPSSSTTRTTPPVSTGANLPTSLPTSTQIAASVSIPGPTGPTPATTPAPLSARTPVPTSDPTPVARLHPVTAATVVSSPVSVP